MAVSDKVQTMTAEAGKQLLDHEARKYLGVSGEEFLSAWDKGAYKGKADTPEVMRLVEIIPFARQMAGRTADEATRSFIDPLQRAISCTLFLTMPISWRGTIQQYAGRLHRLHADKKLVQIYDYADLNVAMLGRMRVSHISEHSK